MVGNVFELPVYVEIYKLRKLENDLIVSGLKSLFVGLTLIVN